jgi:hypothetical protein
VEFSEGIKNLLGAFTSYGLYTIGNREMGVMKGFKKNLVATLGYLPPHLPTYLPPPRPARLIASRCLRSLLVWRQEDISAPGQRLLHSISHVTRSGGTAHLRHPGRLHIYNNYDAKVANTCPRIMTKS